MRQSGSLAGIDIAAPEKHAFTADGMANFEELYRTVAVAATRRGAEELAVLKGRACRRRSLPAPTRSVTA